MWRPTGLSIILCAVLVGCLGAEIAPRSGDELVSKVLRSCGDMGCVKENVLEYLDNVLGIQTDSRSAKSLDAAIFKRAARVLETHEFRMKVPSFIAENTDIVYNPSNGLDVAIDESANECMPMPMMTMAPAPEPAPMYGPPSTPSSYEPAWEQNSGGPYARVWTPTSNNDAQNLAYNGYYNNINNNAGSSTTRP